MKASSPTTERGITRLEVLVVVVVLVGLAIFVFPVFRAAAGFAQRNKCVDNLRSVGLALRILSTDHNGILPMDLSIKNGGTAEWLTDGSQLWRHWRTFSNDPSSTNDFSFTDASVLVCPADKARHWPKPFFRKSWPQISQLTDNSHLSYFLGLNASEASPQTILAGDRNLSTNGVAVGPGRLLLQTNTVLGFTAEIHNQAGNILLGDFSVQPVSNRQLTKAWQDAQTNSGLATNVWLVP
jgi:type II secretory pathway pseudopilin PulG